MASARTNIHYVTLPLVLALLCLDLLCSKFCQFQLFVLFGNRRYGLLSVDVLLSRFARSGAHSWLVCAPFNSSNEEPEDEHQAEMKALSDKVDAMGTKLEAFGAVLTSAVASLSRIEASIANNNGKQIMSQCMQRGRDDR